MLCLLFYFYPTNSLITHSLLYILTFTPHLITFLLLFFTPFITTYHSTYTIHPLAYLSILNYPHTILRFPLSQILDHSI